MDLDPPLEIFHLVQGSVTEHAAGDRLVAIDQRLVYGETGSDIFPHAAVELTGQGLFELADVNVVAPHDVAAVRLDGAGDEAEQRRLAGTVTPDYAHPFARFEREVGVAQDDLLTETERDVVEIQQGHGAGPWRRRDAAPRKVRACVRRRRTPCASG